MSAALPVRTSKPTHGWLSSGVLALTIITVTSILLSWASGTGLQCDELLILRVIEMGPLSEGLMTPGSSHPPLGRLLVDLAGSKESPDWVLRTPSIIAGLLTVAVWYHILRLLFADKRIIALLLPSMALSRGWLEIAYQVTPYSFLTFFVSLHCLSWLLLLRKRNLPRILLFSISGVAPVWTHFYGINVLIADQVIWLLLFWRQRDLWRVWLTTTASHALLAAFVLPLLQYYAAIEETNELLNIHNYAAYFILASGYFFRRLTFNYGEIVYGENAYAAAVDLEAVLPSIMTENWLPCLILVWYLPIGIFVWRWLFCQRRGQVADHAVADPTTTSCLGSLAIIVMIGVFLAGFPAMQGHSLVSGKAMWGRYAVMAAWSHWPLLTLFVRHALSSRAALGTAMLGFACTILPFVPPGQLRQHWTFNDRPAVTCMQEFAKPGDAFFAQDMDFWTGDAAFDRMWFERYASADMPVITGPTMQRFELAKNGIPFDTISPEIDRIWVYSVLFNGRQLHDMQTNEWRLIAYDRADSTYALAVFSRQENSQSDSVSNPS